MKFGEVLGMSQLTFELEFYFIGLLAFKRQPKGEKKKDGVCQESTWKNYQWSELNQCEQ